MKNTIKLTFSGLLLITCYLLLDTTWAAGSSSTYISPDSIQKTTDSDRVMPIIENEKNYIFDETGAKAMLKQKSSLLKVNCNPVNIVKELGLTANVKVISVGIEESDFQYSFDFKNCSMRGNKVNQVRSNKSLTEAQALQFAKDFVTKAKLKSRIFDKFGDPVITYRNNGGGPILYKEGMSYRETDEDSGIEIDPNDTGDLQQEYTSFSMVLPYTLNGRKIYNQYGGVAGVTLEVTADGVNSISVPLLPFKGAIRNAEKVTEEGLISYIKRGGNSPFRGQASEVKLNKPERIFIYSTLWRNNTSELYISSGIRFGSNILADQRAQQPYEMIIDDYKIFNNNMY